VHGVDWPSWVSSVGLPGAIALYVLARIEPAIGRLNQTVQLLAIVVARATGQDWERVRSDFGGKE
jgi:hypothetical protein